MILIADGGSTKVDWVAIDANKNEIFRTRTLGLNPNVVSKDELYNRVIKNELLNLNNEKVNQVYFYGAGCGTNTPKEILKETLSSFFSKATVEIEEDIIGAVYASSGKNESIVCILGTGSNSCYYNGHKAEYVCPALGYTLMDEASGNYFGKKLLRDYFYKQMPKQTASKFSDSFSLNPDEIKHHLYKDENPNRYLATFAKFLIENKNDNYVIELVKNGFRTFFNYHIKSYQKHQQLPIYFIGSIAHFFEDILNEIALEENVNIKGVIQRPIDNLIDFHRSNL
ncbi:BadF-type ATPase [Tenacibaculum sp. 190524A02b]|uniref:BadF-type ATPase n=1 Tax=Tenacibaculum vairaonense TaxID=3137860 RepID=A0ABP1F9L5_9FLAO